LSCSVGEAAFEVDLDRLRTLLPFRAVPEAVANTGSPAAGASASLRAASALRNGTDHRHPPAPGLGLCVPDLDHAVLEVDVGPAQRAQLSHPQPGQGQHKHRRQASQRPVARRGSVACDRGLQHSLQVHRPQHVARRRLGLATVALSDRVLQRDLVRQASFRVDRRQPRQAAADPVGRQPARSSDTVPVRGWRWP
jgi:hypothetical protein